MLVLLISILVLTLGIVFLCLSDWDWKEYAGVILTLLGAIATIVCVICIIVASVRPDVKLQKDMNTYDTLVYAIEKSDGQIFEHSTAISEYNNYVYDCKEFHDSPWIGWFYYDGCEKLPYIELENN